MNNEYKVEGICLDDVPGDDCNWEDVINFCKDFKFVDDEEYFSTELAKQVYVLRWEIYCLYRTENWKVGLGAYSAEKLTQVKIKLKELRRIISLSG